MKTERKIALVLGMTLMLTGIGFSQVNGSQLMDGAENESGEMGNSLINDASNFLTSTSPAFLIILGIILVVGSGFAKIVGYILIVFAVIRLLLNLL